MPGLIETDGPTSSQDITSSLLIGSYTASAAGLVIPQVRLSGLNGAAAVITLKMVLNDGTDDHPHARGSDLKDADADTRFARDLSPVWMNSGDILKVYAESSNASDTAATVTVRFIDAGNPVDEVSADVTKISGDATAADNLEAAADGTGYNLGGGSIVADSVTNNVGGNVTGSVGSVTAGVSLTSAAIDAIEAALVNEGDATALLQAIGDKIAADLTAGDLTAVAIASAVRTNLTVELDRIDATFSSLPNSTRDAILDRVLSGNHDTDGTVGKLLQSLGITFAPGTAAAASAGASSLTITGLAMDASKYAKQYVLLQEGNGQGFASEILATSTGTTFNLKDALPAAVTLNDAVLILGKAR